MNARVFHELFFKIDVSGTVTYTARFFAYQNDCAEQNPFLIISTQPGRPSNYRTDEFQEPLEGLNAALIKQYDHEYLATDGYLMLDNYLGDMDLVLPYNNNLGQMVHNCDLDSEDFM